MIEAPLALAFGSGMVATVNPCGFALLPAYLSFFLGVDDPSPDARASVPRALAVGATVTLGFVAVFGLVGALVSHASSAIEEWLPYIDLALGVGLVVLGVAMLAGFQVTLSLPHLARGGNDRSLPSMFLFGVSYALASLSCTLPVFLGPAVAGTFTSSNVTSGLAVFGAYALGMGLVLVVLTVALALARQSIVGRMRSALRYVNRVSGALLVLAGAYVTWYGAFALRVQDDPETFAGPVDWVTGWSADITSWVQSTGPERIGLALAALICVIAAWAVMRPAESGSR